jgi:hypothetical protein
MAFDEREGVRRLRKEGVMRRKIRKATAWAALSQGGIGAVILVLLGTGAAGIGQRAILPSGTELVAELEEDVDTRLIGEEGRVQLRLTHAVVIGGKEVVPRGARILGVATAEQDEDGNFSTLVVHLREISLGVRTLPIVLRVKALEPPPPPKEMVPTETGEPRRGPRIEVSGGISIRRIPDPGIPEGKPSRRGVRRESVELMKVSTRDSGVTEITLPGEDISLRPGTRFRLVVSRDVEIR